MRYNDIEHLIRSGDLIAYTTGDSIFNYLTKLLSQSPYTHVGVALADGGAASIIEAVSTVGVRIAPLVGSLPLYWVRTGVLWTPAVEAFARAHLGQPYSFIDAWRVITGEGPEHDDEVCSVFAGAIYRCAGVPLDPHLDYSPGSLVKYFTDKGFTAHLVE